MGWLLRLGVSASIVCVWGFSSGCAIVQQVLGGPQHEAGVFVGGRTADSLSDADIDRRLAFITDRLDSDELHAKAWQYGWTVINAGGMGIGTGLAATNSGTDRDYGIIEAGKGLIGTAYLLLNPLPGRNGADPLREMPSATRADKLAQLERGEDLLRQAAFRADQPRGWLLHIGNVALNAMGGIALLALNNGGKAALSFFADTATGELEIWTQPWEPATDWKEYEQFATTGGLPATPPVTWRVVPFERGLALNVAF